MLTSIPIRVRRERREARRQPRGRHGRLPGDPNCCLIPPVSHPRHASLALLAAGLCAGTISTRGVASPRPPPPEPRPSGAYPSLPWLAVQLVPSPELHLARPNGIHFGLRWQLTPLLYSFGIHRSLNPTRFFVVEPIVRHAGSVEFYFSPGYVALGDELKDRLLWRGGLRSYFPLVERGEYLSASLGSSVFHFSGDTAAAWDAGLHTIFGIFGVLVSASPGHDLLRASATLNFRFF